ncbi:MAG: M42 family metallopeptidase [Candidatus Cloacimonetes bacterium]|nr:M42 family metallopeptidase [Candidatus Cloacimonadota bacterium]MBS3767850.1 M42 family metallopeptidase [Candidatus Cloacimonadota bacterium]
MADVELLKELCLANGVSGNEEQVRSIMEKRIQNSSQIKYDKLGSIAFYHQGSNDTPKILIVGHMDELGFVVKEITKSGLLKLQPVGGWTPQTILSSQLKVITKDGKEFSGTVGSIPVHHKSKSEQNKVIKISEMYFDIGASSAEEVANYGVRLGDTVISDVDFTYMQESNRVMCKAFDDRVGVCSVIDTMNYFMDKDHPNMIIGAGSVQEEVGTRGAYTLSELVKPDLALVIEGAPADDFPGLRENPQTEVGKGAHIRIWDPTMLVNPRYKNFILETADKFDIKYQCAVRKGGGTDGRVIHLSNIGVPTIVLGVPVRYAHTHLGIISLDDYDQLQKLLQAIIKTLDNDIYNQILNI